MQVIEYLIFLLTITTVVILIKSKVIKKQHMGILIIVTLLLSIVQIIFGSPRWQFIPLYIATILCVSIGTVYIFKPNKYQDIKVMKRIVIIFSSILIGIAVISSFVFPVYEVPTPSGDYLIGTESFILTDESREETYGVEGNRLIKIQLWYPAESVDGYENATWIQDGLIVSQALASSMYLPAFILNHTELIMSNSYIEAPISEALAEYPVVVLSHGWSGLRSLHIDIAEELASLGYIVVTIEHTYGSVATVISDEDIRYLNPDALPSRETNSDFMEYANNLVTTYAGDITLTLNELEKMNDGSVASRFLEKLDLTNIGLIGHSTGGGADVLVALSDNRIKAVIGMDAWVEPIAETDIEKGLDMPALFLRSEAWETGDNNINLYGVVEESDSALIYQIDGTIHYDFSMVYMFSPISKYLGITGEVPKEQMVSILKRMITSFFDENLKDGTRIDLNNMDQVWEEVQKIE